MPEPTSPAALAGGGAAAITAGTLALLGVDYYALVGAFLGVLLTVSSVKPASSGLRVGLSVAITTLAAAVLGQGFVQLASTAATRPIVMLVSLLCGAGGQVVVQAAVESLIARIKQLGGQ